VPRGGAVLGRLAGLWSGRAAGNAAPEVVRAVFRRSPALGEGSETIFQRFEIIFQRCEIIFQRCEIIFQRCDMVFSAPKSFSSAAK
jgi:hypothetical protein